MNIITVKDGVVTKVAAVAAGSTALVSEAAPRIGSLHQGGDVFRAPGDAVQIADGVVASVIAGRWAEDQAGPGWINAAAGAARAGMTTADGATFAEPVPPRDVAAEAAAHGLALKMGAINALRTDGGPAWPATAEALTAARETYRDLVDDYNSAVAVGETVTEEQTATIRLIRAGFQFFKAVDAAAAAIVSAGDAADPIASDTRWPAPPTAG